MSLSGDVPPLNTAGDVEDNKSLAHVFWTHIGRDEPQLAEEVARRVHPPSISAFSFEDGDVSEEVGTFAPSAVDPDTPSQVTDSWNHLKSVNCVLVDPNWCLAAFQGTHPDFKACTLIPNTKGGQCRKSLHADVKGKPAVLRMDVSDPEGVYGIVCPASGGTKQTTCFSRPTFKLSSFPESLRVLKYHETLLSFRFRPAVWKVLFEGYPGPTALMDMVSDNPRKPSPSSSPPTSGDQGTNKFNIKNIVVETSSVQSKGSDSIKSMTAQAARGATKVPPALNSDIINVDRPSRGPDKPSAIAYTSTPARELVTEAPGLASTVTEFYDAQTSGRRPPSSSRQTRVNSPRALSDQFAWAAASHPQGKGDDSSSIGDFSKVSGTPSSQRRGGADSALLAEAVSSIKALTKRVEVLELYNSRLNTSLADTFAKLRSAQQATRDMVDAMSDPYADDFRLNYTDRASLLAELEHSVGLDRLNEYVKHSELPGYDYASHSYVNGQLASLPPPTLPHDLTVRLTNLEAAVIHPTGAVEQLKCRLKDMEDMQIGKAVSIAGYTFKDSKDVEVWLATLKIDEAYRFAFDAKSQLSGCAEDFVSVGESLANKSAAIKAGFGSYKSARLAATFDMTYPTIMIKASSKAEDVSHGGYSFTPPFASRKAFEGDIEHSTLESLKTQLRDNMNLHQNAIDTEFPPDMPKHTRTHAIFSYILRRGYFHAVGLLDSILPFHRLMTGAGVDEKEAWKNKMLTYVMAIWDRIQAVRTVTSEATDGTMIFGIMKATDLLDGYGKLEWIRHPDISSAMIIASLQRDGRGGNRVNSLMSELQSSIRANSTGWHAQQAEISRLKGLNPGWNT